MTHAHCDGEIARLGVLRGVPGDVVEYFAALEDIPDERFTLAVNHALKTRSWFPTPAELRADCDAVHVVTPTTFESYVQDVPGGGRDVTITNPFTGQTITLHVTREWKCDCADCADSGWREMQCPTEHCGRRFDHDAHPYVVRCHCIDWNPTLKRHKEGQAKYSQPAAKA